MNSMSMNVENYSPQIIRRLVKELTELQNDSCEGIRVNMNFTDVTDIQATIDGPAGTPYQGGAFKVKLALSKDFPASPPKAYFLTKIFHPNVAANGEICVNTLKKDWKSDLGIKHILLTIKCLLIVPNAESALNDEAGKLLLERYDDYSSRAKIFTEIHAQPIKSSNENCSSNSSAAATSTTHTSSQDDEGPFAKKQSLEQVDKKTALDKKKEKLLKEKKQRLKRL